MPKAMQKTLLKLGIAGFLALLIFNYPLLSLYRGYWWSWPVLYLGLFGVWLVVIVIARHITEPSVAALFKTRSGRNTR